MVISLPRLLKPQFSESSYPFFFVLTSQVQSMKNFWFYLKNISRPHDFPSCLLSLPWPRSTGALAWVVIANASNFNPGSPWTQSQCSSQSDFAKGQKMPALCWKPSSGFKAIVIVAHDTLRELSPLTWAHCGTPLSLLWPEHTSLCCSSGCGLSPLPRMVSTKLRCPTGCSHPSLIIPEVPFLTNPDRSPSTANPAQQTSLSAFSV